MKQLFSSYLIRLQKYEIIIAGIAVFLVVIGLSIRFLLPNFTKAQMIFSQQSQLERRLSALKTKDKLLSSLDYQYYRENVPKINQVLPFSKDYVSLFNTLDNLQGKTGITILRTEFALGVISTSSASLAETSGNAAILPVTLGVTGDISSLQSFLQSLMNLGGRIFTIDEIQLSFKESGLIQAQLSGKSYFYPPPASIGSIVSPLPGLNSNLDELLKKIAENPLSVSNEEDTRDITAGKRNLFQ